MEETCQNQKICYNLQSVVVRLNGEFLGTDLLLNCLSGRVHPCFFNLSLKKSRKNSKMDNSCQVKFRRWSMSEEKKANVEEVKDTAEVKEETTAKAIFVNGDLNHYADIRTDIPEIRTGDVVRVSYRVIEGGKERIQIFEGVVIAMKSSGVARTMTVRKTSFGIAVERIFPLNSKLVQKVEVKKHSKVRRAKLYYLRNLSGKAARLKELRK